MTIAFGGIGAKSTGGTTTTAVAYPASVGAGDYLLLADAGWPSSAGVNAISGWAVTQLSGGTGSAIDAHDSTIAAFRKEAAGGETGTVSVGRGGTPNGQLGVMARYTRTGSSWAAAAVASGTDNTHGADRSITTGTLDLAPGDMVVLAVGVDTDAALTITSPTLTASGITFGTVNRRTSGAGDAIGNDGNVELFDALVTAGTGTVAVTFAFTTATSQCGPLVATRLREVVAAQDFTGTAGLSGSGVLSTVAAVAVAATVALTGSGSLDATTSPAYSSAATLSGTGTLGTTGSPSTSRTASLSGSGALTATSSVSASASVALSGSGQLATARTIAASGSAALAAAGSLSATGSPSTSRAVSLNGSGSLTTSSTPGATQAAALSGSGSLTASATAPGSASVTLSGAGSLTVTTTLQASRASALSGAGSLTAVGASRFAVTVALAGSGSMQAAGLPTLAQVVDLSGSGTLDTAGTPVTSGAADLSGSGQLAATGRGSGHVDPPAPTPPERTVYVTAQTRVIYEAAETRTGHVGPDRRTGYTLPDPTLPLVEHVQREQRTAYA